MRLSNESFAEHLGIGVRTVAGWHQKPTLRPKSEMQQLLDTALEQASPAVKERFTTLASQPAQTKIVSQTNTEPEQDGTAADTELRLSADPNIGAALDWLDQHAEWEPGTARRRVASRLARLDVSELRDRGHRRGRVNQRHIAHALSEYYRDRTENHGRYSVRYDTDSEATTSILTCPDWLDINCPLIATHDRLSVTSQPAGADMSLNEHTAESAVQRLAETLALDIRFFDMPVYRLLGIDVREGKIKGLGAVIE